MSVLTELNRRNVFRVALLYIVACWLLLQFTSITFELLGIPDWVHRFLFALLFILFPLVLGFSWMFEITPEGIKREQHIDSRLSITHLTAQRINRITKVLLLVAVVLFVAENFIPTSEAQTSTVPDKVFDMQGHRGARGMYPENTIPSFIYALDLGVTTLEMDVVINADGHVYLSHEPWMSEKICAHADARPVKANEAKSLNIYQMSDAEISSFDCGSRGNARFKQQKAMPASKPQLNSVIKAVLQRSTQTERTPVFFNIEIKSAPEGDNVFHPPVEQFAKAVYDVVKQHHVIEYTSIQSFDPRALEATHLIDPDISTVLLVDNHEGFEKNLKRLSFRPDVYSPNYERLNKSSIDSANALGILVIPWTVNSKKVMLKLMSWGVDGLITDYPALGMQALTEFQQQQ